MKSINIVLFSLYRTDNVRLKTTTYFGRVFDPLWLRHRLKYLPSCIRSQIVPLKITPFFDYIDGTWPSSSDRFSSSTHSGPWLTSDLHVKNNGSLLKRHSGEFRGGGLTAVLFFSSSRFYILYFIRFLYSRVFNIFGSLKNPRFSPQGP